MGRYTNTAVVPFIRRGEDVNNFISYLRKEFYSMERSKDPPDSYITYNGWNFYLDCAESFNDHNGNGLSCDVIEKNDMTIYIVNEDQN